MARDEIERAEVDRLVEELASRRVPKPVVPHAAPAEITPVSAATEHHAPAPGRRWTTARLLMPAVTTKEPRKAFAFASAMHLPALPRLSLPALTQPQWTVLTARMFVGLGLVLSAAMPYWPYANACSWGLGLYLSAVLLVVVTGIWGAKLTWDARLGTAHSLALCIVFWGLALVAATVLPHVGYAGVQGAWVCP